MSSSSEKNCVNSEGGEHVRYGTHYRCTYLVLCGLALADVQLRSLGLALRGQREVRKVELGTLRVGADEIRLLGVQEGQRLRARSIRVHAHVVLLRVAA